jgi:hypothetical protein
MLPLEDAVHRCEDCKKDELLKGIVNYAPVYSFGDPSEKNIVLMVIGVNPSDKEYEGNPPHLSKDPDREKRRDSQLNYFYSSRGHEYKYFRVLRAFFEGHVKNELGWDEMPWERVGYLDLVKCPTRTAIKGQKGKTGQWSKLERAQKDRFIEHCKGYLKEQLKIYRPKNILAYGTDVCDWFRDYLDVKCEDFEDTPAQLNGEGVNILFVPQRQGSQSKPEVDWVRKKILKMLKAEIRSCSFDGFCNRVVSATVS